MYLQYFSRCVQDGTVKLWNYQRGEILDDVDCSAYIDSGSEATAGECDTDNSSHHSSRDIRCMASSHRLLAVSFNG